MDCNFFQVPQIFFTYISELPLPYVHLSNNLVNQEKTECTFLILVENNS